MKKIMPLFIMSFLVISMFGCVEPGVLEDGQDQSTGNEINKFDSVSEIKDYLDENIVQGNYYNAFGMARSMDVDTVAMAESAQSNVKSSGSGSAKEYSRTNVQVEGVDEADFVKNDDKYIYVLSQDELVIVDAYPAEDAEIISETEIEGRPANLFVNGDRLVVFSTVYDENYVIQEYDYVPRKRDTPRTHAYVYDISDKEKPELVNDFNINGNYYDARMIGDHVYMISKENVYYYNNLIDVPVVRKGDESVLSPEIYYFDNPEDNYIFHTVASFDIEQDDINAKSYLMGYSNTLMVSKDNIYISYKKNMHGRYYEDERKDRFYEVIVPLLPIDVQDEIDDIKRLDKGEAEKWQEISSVLEEMYNELEEKEKEHLVEEIREAIKEYDTKKEKERMKTVIHKLGIDEGEIEYLAKGEVSGHLLNQFSMDEHKGKLRAATTITLWRGEDKQYNNVYVLDEDMEILGKKEGIAHDERIYSTRFIGDRLYMVTFKRIDPLFVIDLSGDNPEILGELKMPGYSDYLHPYDEDHLIGIGKETKDNGFGGVSVKGVKLALFDVSDVENPELIDNYEIGDSGTDSEALREHKAFLFDKRNDLIVIPIREVKDEDYEQGYGYRRNIWQGAYAIGIGVDDGFELKGKITHTDDLDDNYYWRSPYAVRRSMYMDDVLYTVSAEKIMMNDMDSLDKVNEIELPYKKKNYYPRYY